MQVKFTKKHPEAIEPQYATEGASGLDLHARIDHEIFLHPGVRFTCHTGIGMEIPIGFEGQVRPRSGLAKREGVTVLNAPGTVDADYRGEICVILINHGDRAVSIKPGDRIAQLVIAPVMRAKLVRNDDLSDTARGDGGFGSTGTGELKAA